MARTQRGTIDELGGYTLYDAAPGATPQDDYFELSISTGNPQYTSVTVWGVGLISFGPPTAAQIDFMGDLAANSNLSTFPGDWISFGFPNYGGGPIEVWTGGTWIQGVLISAQGVAGGSAWSISGHDNPADAAFFFWSDLLLSSGTDVNEVLMGTSAPETLHGQGGEDTLVGGGGADALYGDAGNDLIVGSAGVDRLFGGDGNDTLDPGLEVPFTSYHPDFDAQIDGGAGFDTLVMDYSAAGSVSISGDILLSRPFVTNVEALRLTGSQTADVLTGSFYADDLYGNGGFDTLRGGGGDDLLDAGAPNPPTVSVLGPGGPSIGRAVSLDGLFTAGDVPTVSLHISQPATAAVSFGAQRAGGFYSFTVAEAGDQLSIDYELPFNNGLYQFDFVLRDSNGVEIETQPYNQPVIFPHAGTYYLDVVIGTTNYWGSSQIDVTLSLEGADVASANRLYGGSGNDTYVVYAPTDQVIEKASEGTDTVRSSVSYTLGANVENLVLAGTDAINGTGNDLANALTGNAGANVLASGAGTDIIAGGASADTLTGGEGNDMFRDTAAGVNGDTITDYRLGDSIVITDATLGGFNLNLTANTLTYTGGSLTFGSAITGRLVATAAAGGGVELVLWQEATNDFNGDGRSDLMLRNDDGTAINWLGQGNGAFLNNASNSSVNPGDDWHIAGTGDFNGDNFGDVLWRSDAGAVVTLLGQPSGGFVGNVNFALNPGLDWHVVGTGDFDGDGYDDILWRNDIGTVVDLLGQSNGAFVGNVSFNLNPGLDWHVAGTGDFNGDGRDDILWRNDIGNVVTLLGAPNGSFVGNVNFQLNPGLDWHIVGTGDFNGDGRDDILWRNDIGNVVDLLGQANGSFIGNVNFSLNPGLDWHIEGTGDFNGDGYDDILWRNDAGTITNLLGQPNGAFLGNIANLALNPSAAWHVEPHATLL